MRPPQFAGEDYYTVLTEDNRLFTSMRPPQFAGEDEDQAAAIRASAEALQ